VPFLLPPWLTRRISTSINPCFLPKPTKFQPKLMAILAGSICGAIARVPDVTCRALSGLRRGASERGAIEAREPAFLNYTSPVAAGGGLRPRPPGKSSGVSLFAECAAPYECSRGRYATKEGGEFFVDFLRMAITSFARAILPSIHGTFRRWQIPFLE
jgi:hypothetical protein